MLTWLIGRRILRSFKLRIIADGHEGSCELTLTICISAERVLSKEVISVPACKSLWICLRLLTLHRGN